MGETWWTVEDVRMQLRGGRLAPTTVSTVVRRLHAKGLLVARRIGRADAFRRVDTSSPDRVAALLAARQLIERHRADAVCAFVEAVCEEPALVRELSRQLSTRVDGAAGLDSSA